MQKGVKLQACNTNTSPMAHPHQEEEKKEDEDRLNVTHRRRSYDDLFAALPADDSWWGHRLRRYRDFWYPELALPLILSINQTFRARPSDILLVSQPKSGTTWLKALAFSILNRSRYSPSARQEHPLLRSNPHDCIPFLRSFYDNETLLPNASLDALPSPRLIALHHSCSTLPDSAVESGCRIVYLARDPKDTLVSHWHFFESVPAETAEPLSFDKAFELFCRGVSFYGPVWEHQLEYWQLSVRQPEKVMFLKYEHMMQDAARYVKKLAEFMECPISDEEEEGGVVEEIVRLCSFESLSGAEVNRVGDWGADSKGGIRIKNSAFFRKGKVGDWKNHMSAKMAKMLDEIAVDKFRGSGLSFAFS